MHLLSLGSLNQTRFEEIVARAAALALRPDEVRGRLAGCTIGLQFMVTSTRTRTSFAAAAAHMGAVPIVYNNADLQLNTGESHEDTARVLSGYLTALIVRAPVATAELERVACSDRMAVINAMSADEHPTQALSDFAYMLRHFGDLSGRRLLYLGEGNSTAVALALAASRVRGMEIQLATPAGYGLPPTIHSDVARLSHAHGGRVYETHDLREIDGPFDVIYTARWQTTGTSKPDPQWRQTFEPFRASLQQFQRLRRDSRSIFMHDLPAVRGDDCEAQLLDGPHSVAFAQAHQKMYTAMAIFDVCTPR